MYVWLVAFVVLLANIASAEQVCSDEFDREYVRKGTKVNGVYTGVDKFVKVIFKFNYLKLFKFGTLDVVPIENIDELVITGYLDRRGYTEATFENVTNTVTTEAIFQKNDALRVIPFMKLTVAGKSKNGGAPKFQITTITACLVPKAAQKVQSFASVVKEDGESQVTFFGCHWLKPPVSRWG